MGCRLLPSSASVSNGGCLNRSSGSTSHDDPSIASLTRSCHPRTDANHCGDANNASRPWSASSTSATIFARASSVSVAHRSVRPEALLRTHRSNLSITRRSRVASWAIATGRIPGNSTAAIRLQGSGSGAPGVGCLRCRVEEPAHRGLADRVQHEAPAQQPGLARSGCLRRALGGSATRWTLIRGGLAKGVRSRDSQR